jgi:hypothetical protein
MGTVSVDGTQTRFDGAAVRRVQELNEMFSAGEIPSVKEQRAQSGNVREPLQKPVVVQANPQPAKKPPEKPSNGKLTVSGTNTSGRGPSGSRSNVDTLKAQLEVPVNPKTKLLLTQSKTYTQSVGADGKLTDTSTTASSAKLTVTPSTGVALNLEVGRESTAGTSTGFSNKFSDGGRLRDAFLWHNRWQSR